MPQSISGVGGAAGAKPAAQSRPANNRKTVQRKNNPPPQQKTKQVQRPKNNPTAQKGRNINITA